MTNNHLETSNDWLKAIDWHLNKPFRRRQWRMTDYWQYLCLTTIKGKPTPKDNYGIRLTTDVYVNCAWQQTKDNSRVTTDVQEADQLKHAGRVVSTMQKKDHLQLWSGSTNCFDYSKTIIVLKHSLKGNIFKSSFLISWSMSQLFCLFIFIIIDFDEYVIFRTDEGQTRPKYIFNKMFH